MDFGREIYYWIYERKSNFRVWPRNYLTCPQSYFPQSIMRIAERNHFPVSDETSPVLPYPSSIPLEVEYTISKNFLNRISHSLLKNQLQAISKTNDLLDQLASPKSKDPAKNLTATRSQISTITSLNDWGPRDDEDRRLISRKSPKALPAEWEIERSLRDIEQNCSRKTLGTIRNLLEDSKRMKRVIIHMESIQKTSRQNKSHYEALDQESIILKNQIVELHGELSRLRTENQNIIRTRDPKGSHADSSSNQLFFTEHLNSLKCFILAKENFTNQKAESLQAISEKIQSSLSNQQEEEECQKCCSFMKKIKSSLLGYRKYLEKQEEELNLLFEECKRILIFQ